MILLFCSSPGVCLAQTAGRHFSVCWDDPSVPHTRGPSNWLPLLEDPEAQKLDERKTSVSDLRNIFYNLWQPEEMGKTGWQFIITEKKSEEGKVI